MEPPKPSVRFSATLLQDSPISKYTAAFLNKNNDDDDEGVDDNDDHVMSPESLRDLDSEWITADGYIEPKYQSLTEKGIRLLCSELLELKKASAEEMRKNVYANYTAFIRTSQELGELEMELTTIQTLISTHAALVRDLFEGMNFQSSPSNPNGAPESQDLSKQEDGRGFLDLEKRCSSLADVFDVCLAERKVDEALSALDEAETLLLEAKKQDLELATATHFSLVFSERRAGFVGQLVEAVWQSSIRGSELRKITSVLNRLGDGVRAHKLLLSSYHMRIQNGVKNLRPSCSWYAGTYIATLAQLYFSLISQASLDSTSIFGNLSAFASELVLWACKETEDYVLLLKKHILSLSALSYGIGAAADCVQISLGYCALLEKQGLSLCPLLLRSLKPCIEGVIESCLTRMEESIRVYVVSDYWSIVTELPGWKAYSYAKLSISAHKLNSMVQDFLQDIAPMVLTQFGKLALDGISNNSCLYVELLMRALPGANEGKGEEKLAQVNTAKTEAQQLVVLNNAEELVPLSGLHWQQSASLRREPQKDGQESLTVLGTRSAEMKDWRRRIQRAVDDLRDLFCEQYMFRLLFDNKEKPLLTAETYLRLPDTEKPQDEGQGLLPSPPIQALFKALKSLEHLANDVLAGKRRMITVLFTRLTEVFVIRMSTNDYFWGPIEDGPQSLDPDGLQQFVLDMQFILQMALAGNYSSRKMRQTISSMIVRAENAFSGTGIDSKSVLQDDQWFKDNAKEALRKILAEVVADLQESCHLNSVSESLSHIGD